MARKPFPWKPASIVGGLALLVGLIVAYQLAIRSIIQGYYRASYAPQELNGADVPGEPPAAHRLTNVPWLSEDLGVCQSISLQMLAAQQGVTQSRNVVDFFMGFTWGATGIPGRTGFFPGQDPEPGFLQGARYLGFTRRYLTTKDQALYVRALRSWLGRGRAVRVAVDRGALLGERGVVPHSLVLVGYDAAGFEYYEPVCDDAKRCKPGQAAPGAPGLTVTTERLLMAVESHALTFQYPWTYQLLVLEPSTAAKPDPAGLLPLNGRALIGHAGPGPTAGAIAVEDTAKAIERHGDGVLKPELLNGVKVAEVVRHDDALALLALFPGRQELAGVAERLDEAARQYGLARAALEAKELEQAVTALRTAARLDHEAGEALTRLAP